MKAVVLALTSATPSVQGYAKRYLSELTSGVFAGTLTEAILNDLHMLLTKESTRGMLIVFSSMSETGYTFVYFNEPNRRLVDFDGAILVEILKT